MVLIAKIREKIIPAILIILLIACASPTLVGFAQKQPTLILCSLILLPLSFTINEKEKSFRYIPLALFFGVFGFVLHADAVKLACFWFTILCFVEAYLGKTSNTLFFLPFIYIPISKSLISVFGYPLRTMLTKIAGTLFSLFDEQVTLEGSKIIYQQESFFVDTACAGIMLFSTSSILFYFMQGRREAQLQRQFSFVQSSFFTILNFVFLILANLARIFFLIFFRFDESHYMHDGTGLLALVIFNIVPMYLILRFSSPKKAKSTTIKSQHIFLILTAIVCASTQLLHRKDIDKALSMNLNPKIIQAATSQVHQDGVTEIRNHNSVIYLKPQEPFRLSNHNPLICWEGSGFKVSNEHYSVIDGGTIFTALLTKKGTTLFTTWWYENDEQAYSSEWLWRKDALLNGKNTLLVNVSAATQDELQFLINKYHGRIWKEN